MLHAGTTTDRNSTPVKVKREKDVFATPSPKNRKRAHSNSPSGFSTPSPRNRKRTPSNSPSKSGSTSPAKRRMLSYDSSPSSSGVDSSPSREIDEPVVIPDLSPTVRRSLRDGECTDTVWRMVG